jgi:hypothetical protein
LCLYTLLLFVVFFFFPLGNRHESKSPPAGCFQSNQTNRRENDGNRITLDCRHFGRINSPTPLNA